MPTKERTYNETEIAEKLKDLPGWYLEDGWIRRVYKTDGWPTTLMLVNAIARVGQPLLGAVIFIAISATFYASLGALVPEMDVESAQVRSEFSPLNPPKGAATPDQVAAANQASVDAFHLAMFVGAGLFLIGSAVSWFGLRDERADRAVEAAEAAQAPAAAA
jgi:4a-hydroxytetrahydrobiopterin dehydratase